MNIKKGFTLIELMVVISIVALLSAVVTTNLNSAKSKARDARRLQDIRQIQNALQLYLTTNSAYPSVLQDLVPTHLNELPVDPSSGNYFYVAKSNGSICNDYHLGAMMETINYYDYDRDEPMSGPYCGSEAEDFDVTDPMFDVRP